MNTNELLYLLAGLLGGFFLRHFLPAWIKEEIPELEPALEVATQEKTTEDKGQEVNVKKVFKASRLGDPITPDEVIFDTKGITFNVKTLFSNTESFVLYSDISGVETVESLFLATIKIKPKTRGEIQIDNFTKSDAKLIKKLIQDRLN